MSASLCDSDHDLFVALTDRDALWSEEGIVFSRHEEKRLLDFMEDGCHITFIQIFLVDKTSAYRSDHGPVVRKSPSFLNQVAY